MREELGRWNHGAGISLEAWTSCSGNYALAVGYLTMLWPEFTEFEGYILRADFSVDSLRGFEAQPGISRQSVEWVMNHLHIASLHHSEDDQLTEDKVIVLGNALCEIYRAKLAWQFPNSPCVVEFYQPEESDDLYDYQISFWQSEHEVAQPDASQKPERG